MHVDDDFVRVGGKSYAINKINSIEVREKRLRTRAPAYIWGLLCFLSASGAAGALGSGNTDTLGASVIFAAVFGMLAYRAWHRADEREYTLFLMTSSQEASALVSRNAGEIETVRYEIEEAMRRNGQRGLRGSVATIG